MATILIALFVLCLLVYLVYSYRCRRDEKRLELAQMFHNDLFNKMRKLRDDPFMTDEKWREWLPICRFSDDLLGQCLPSFYSLEGMVKREIKPDEQPNLR